MTSWRSVFWGAGAVAVTSAAAWFAWMGWDQEYQTDPDTGVVSGPYAAWQVIGSALCVVLVVIATAVWLRYPFVLVVPPVAAVSYAIAWSWTAVRTGGEGPSFWPVGAFLVLVGVGIGTTVLTLSVLALRTLFEKRRRVAV